MEKTLVMGWSLWTRVAHMMGRSLTKNKVDVHNDACEALSKNRCCAKIVWEPMASSDRS